MAQISITSRVLLFVAFSTHVVVYGFSPEAPPVDDFERNLSSAQVDDSVWDPGHATFYGGADASGTDGGACGYANPFALGYGELTAAISDMIYDGGLTCGACFEVQCVDSQYCYSNATVVVTATNESPQVTTATPGPHFDLAQPAFAQIANEIAGNLIIQYKRVPCQKQGGIKFQIGGQDHWMSVLVYNVGGAGAVQSISVKGSNTDWIALDHLWGQTWSTGSVLDGQALSFVTTTSDGDTLYSYNVADSNWAYGMTYEGAQYE